MMKRLVLVILLAALAWSGYWLWGKQSLLAGYQRWFAERRAEGWQAGYAEMVVRGFPNRHDTTWTDLEIADPESGLGWQAPFFQLFLLSYNRHHAIAAWPREQMIVTPDGPLRVTSEQMQASLVTEGDDHALTRGNLVADVLNVTGPEGATTALAQLRLAGTRVDAASYDLAMTAEGLALPRGLVSATGGALPQTFSQARIAAQLGFDAPWTLAAAEARPQPTRIAVSEAALEWGPMALRLTGDLEIDGEGRASGEVHVQARNWQEMLTVARASGQVAEVLADGIEAALTLMAGLSGGQGSLDLALRLDAGAIWLGPIPIGEAPRIRLR
ncbi:DUF2125 domain-containing protein [Marinovum sp.]|uniref:DUF2125 domain-containing protein n=1 Tax=Marinovum sp. TaxID=2024839 RepID=UPI002B27A701|nr:DUF2125 domain-containing protein [Marinovum sp.]